MSKELDVGCGQPVEVFPVLAFNNLHLDPREEPPVSNAPPNFWVRYPASEARLAHLASLKKNRQFGRERRTHICRAGETIRRARY